MQPFATHPTVSIVVIFLNEERFIRETIESVLAQTYRDWELLLVDDGSTDGSTAIAREYADQNPGRIHYLEHEAHQNKGMSASRNLGWKKAGGRYMAFLDGDDVWVPEKLTEQVAIFEKHGEVGMICSAALYWYSWQDPTATDTLIPLGGQQDVVCHPPDLFLQLYPLGAGQAPCPSTFMVKKEVLVAVGGFEEHFKSFYEDQAFLSKVYLHTPVFVASTPWLLYRQHTDSCVATVTQQGKYHVVRKYFLEWLAQYLQRHNVKSVAVWLTWRKAYLPYQNPWLHRRLSEGKQYLSKLRGRLKLS